MSNLKNAISNIFLYIKKKTIRIGSTNIKSYMGMLVFLLHTICNLDPFDLYEFNLFKHFGNIA